MTSLYGNISSIYPSGLVSGQHCFHPNFRSVVKIKTRMHSSGIRTAHLLTICQPALGRRGVCLGRYAFGGGCVSAQGLSAQMGCMPWECVAGECLPRACLPWGVPSGCLPRGWQISPRSEADTPSPVDRQTPVKT